MGPASADEGRSKGDEGRGYYVPALRHQRWRWRRQTRTMATVRSARRNGKKGGSYAVSGDGPRRRRRGGDQEGGSGGGGGGGGTDDLAGRPAGQLHERDMGYLWAAVSRQQLKICFQSIKYMTRPNPFA